MCVYVHLYTSDKHEHMYAHLLLAKWRLEREGEEAREGGMGYIECDVLYLDIYMCSS